MNSKLTVNIVLLLSLPPSQPKLGELLYLASLHLSPFLLSNTLSNTL